MTVPHAKGRAHIVLVHGYAEHSGRYSRIANLLHEQGYVVTLFDLRGYGRSTGIPALVSDLDEYVDDLTLVATEHAEPTIPLILFGHSMGGLICLRTVLTKRLQPSALVLSSPALAFFEPKLLQVASSFIGKLIPKLPTIPLDRSLVSRDSEVVNAALRDPLCYQGKIKAGTGASMVRAARQVNVMLPSLTTPFLVFHGEEDKLVDSSGSKQLFEEASSTDKTIKIYQDSVHETLNDFGHEQVESDILDWLRDRY